MNFVDFCIKTKNYSAISAINEYTKQFGRTNKYITDRPLRIGAAKELNELRKHPYTDKDYKNIIDKYTAEQYKNDQKRAKWMEQLYYYNIPDYRGRDRVW